MKSIEAIRVFVRVAELASFTLAAASLGLPKASISLAVQRLENELGTRLLHRTTRRVQLTQDGHVFYERSRDLLVDLDELQSLFRDDRRALHGRLRVDMPVAVARDLVLPNLPDFLAIHPALELELSSTDRLVDLIREGFDCVLRVGVLTDSSLIAKPLGQYHMISCASPAYVARMGRPRRPADLHKHRLVHYAATLGSRDSGFEYVDPDDPSRVVTVDMPVALTVNNVDAYFSACLAGLGIIQVPEIGARDALRKGQLIEILPRHRAAPMPVTLLYANRRHQPRRVQVFMSWLEGLLRPRLSPLDASERVHTKR